MNPHTAARTLGPFDPVPVIGLPPIVPGLETFLANFTFRAIHYPSDFAPQFP